jgi:hypothetical protein
MILIDSHVLRVLTIKNSEDRAMYIEVSIHMTT